MTRQFDVVVNSFDRNGSIPYLLVLQHRFIDIAQTVVVAPLHRVTNSETLNPRLCPAISVGGETLHCVMYQLAAIPKRALGRTVSSAEDCREDIIRAYDMIISGI